MSENLEDREKADGRGVKHLAIRPPSLPGADHMAPHTCQMSALSLSACSQF